MSKPQAKIVRLSFGLFVAVYGDQSPSDEEWAVYMDTMRTITPDDSLVIFSWGGYPTMKQRRVLEEAVTHHEGKVAVVTESRIARGVVKAISWTGKQIKAFDFSRRDAAFEFLDLSDSERDQALNSARSLARDLQLDDATKLAS